MGTRLNSVIIIAKIKMGNFKIIFVVFFACILSVFDCYKVLVVFPMPVRSHNNLGNSVVRNLLNVGHEVTYITPFPFDPHPKLDIVDISSLRGFFSEKYKNISMQMTNQVDLNDDKIYVMKILEFTNTSLQHENVVRLMNDVNQKFDVVIAQWIFNEVFSGFSALFTCPYIWLNPYEPNSISLSLVDEPTNPAYVPQQQFSNKIPPFTFLERAKELYNLLRSMILKKFYFTAYESDVYENAFKSVMTKKGRILPSYNDVRYNASLVLGNSHVTLGNKIKLPQNYKEIGGFHIEDAQTLPKGLHKIMEESRDGVIYFSLGSSLKSKDLAPEIKTKLLKVFAKLKQTVIWKLEEDFSNLPKNIHVTKWAPQQSILAHPNCVLFISHGGLLSTYETVHFGVPIIGIPVFADQFATVEKAVREGYAKKVELSYNLAEDLEGPIHEILRDPRYRLRAKEVSAAYHDRVVTPGTELVHWVEHVARTKGALHLRSPSINVPFYQKCYLDLVALVIILVILIKKLSANVTFLTEKEVRKIKNS